MTIEELKKRSVKINILKRRMHASSSESRRVADLTGSFSFVPRSMLNYGADCAAAYMNAVNTLIAEIEALSEEDSDRLEWL